MLKIKLASQRGWLLLLTHALQLQLNENSRR
jgi:hypothetical protein